MRHRRPLAPLVVVTAALGLTPAGAGAQALAAREAPAAAASDPARPLPPPVLDALLKRIAAEGRDNDLPGPIAQILGLSAGGEVWPNRQFAVRSQATGAIHAAAVGTKTGSDLILSSRGDAAITILRLRRDGTLVGGAYYFPQTQSGSAAPPALAAHDFADERGFWMRTVDALAAAD